MSTLPAIIGGARVITVTLGGAFHVGDAIEIAPKNVTKTFTGSGSSNTGDFPVTINPLSATNSGDTDVVDQQVSSPI